MPKLQPVFGVKADFVPVHFIGGGGGTGQGGALVQAPPCCVHSLPAPPHDAPGPVHLEPVSHLSPLPGPQVVPAPWQAEALPEQVDPPSQVELSLGQVSAGEWQTIVSVGGGVVENGSSFEWTVGVTPKVVS